MDKCPCCSSAPFASCCAPLLGGQAASTAEQLMRSRYTAYCLNNTAYLEHTLHPEQRRPEDTAQLGAAGKTLWLGLRIIASGVDWVEFVAFYELQGRLQQLHEKSRFCCEAGTWFYLDGDFLPPLKLARNEACPCGRGDKYKKCHGR